MKANEEDIFFSVAYCHPLIQNKNDQMVKRGSEAWQN
jgi:hypothetical protein